MVRQQEDFLVLMENYDTYQDLVKTSQNSAGTAETKYQSYLDSYAAAKNEMTAAIEGLVNSSGLNKLLTDLTKIGTNLVDFFGQFMKYVPTLLAGIVGIRAFLGKSVLNYAGNAISKQLKNGTWAAEGSGAKGVAKWLGETKIGSALSEKMGLKKKTTSTSAATKADEKLQAQKLNVIKKEQQALNKEVTFKQKIATIASAEAEDKATVATQANLEAMKKAGVVTDAQLEEAQKQGVLSDGQMEWIQKRGVITYSQLEKMQKAGILDDAKIEAQYKEQVREDAAAEASSSGSSSGSGVGSKISAVLSGISMLSAGIASSISQYSTAATTHEYNGETVESSEEAQKQGAGWSAVFNLASGIPIIGTFVGMLGETIAENVAAAYDKERDEANAQTSEANTYISALSSLNSNIEAIGEADFGTTDFYDAIEAFSEEIFSEDNEDTRALLEQYLGGDTSIYDVLQRIQSNTEESAKAYRELRLAQLEAQKSQIANKYSSQLYNAQVNTSDAYADYSAYKPNNSGTVVGSAAVGTAIGAGAGAAAGGIAALGIAATAAGGITAAGVANAWNPVGWILLGIGAVAGLTIGIISGIQEAQAQDEKDRAEYAEKSEWAMKTNAERIAEVTEQVNAARADIDAEGNAEIVKNGEDLLAALEEQISLTNEMLDEMDDITAQEALITANVLNGSGDALYLEDMTKGQLKNLGIDNILLAYAKAIEENGGLYDQEIWEDEDHTKLSDAGRSYVMTKLRAQDDEEINAILSGESYTLNEVLKLREKYGDATWIMDLMKNFATSLGVTVDQLEEVKNKYGELTYAETLMTASELQDRIGNFTDLIGDIVTGTGDTSEWMQTIISEFPELIAYMSDTPTLLGKITEKLQELAEVAIQTQYNDVMADETYFSTVEDNFYSRLLQENNGETAKEALESMPNMSSFSDVVAWLKEQYDPETGELSETGKAVYNALMDTVDGVTLESDYLKDYYDQIIEAQTTIYDNEIDNLTEQKEALEQINNQREYENKLIEAKLKLENAQKEKKRVYRAGVGWVYESDQSAILEAQENLTSVENEKTISSLEAEIAELEYQKEQVSSVYDKQNAENLQKLYDKFVDGLAGKGTDNIFSAIKDGISGITYSLQDLIGNDLNGGFSSKEDALSQLATDWANLQKQTKGTKEYNAALAKYQQTMTNAKKVGVTESDVAAYSGLEGTTSTSTGDKSAWEAGQASNYDKLKYDIKQTVLLSDPDDATKRYSGVVKLSDAQYSTTVLGSLFDDVKSGDAAIWTSDGKAIKIGDDARLVYDESTDSNFLTYLSRILGIDGFSSGNFIISGIGGDTNEAVYIGSGGVPYGITGTNSADQTSLNGLSKVDSTDAVHWLQDTVQTSAAAGSLGLEDTGNALINELGTEAIVTPDGTITALPAHTGIVPADITKNLWELGEVAPSISRTLMANMIPDSLQQNSMSSTTDESLNVNTLNITMNPDGSFDVDSFVNALRSRVALTRNSSK